MIEATWAQDMQDWRTCKCETLHILNTLVPSVIRNIFIIIIIIIIFRINYLRQFSFKFENSCAHHFLKFPKHTQLFTFGLLWTINQKHWKQKKCKFSENPKIRPFLCIRFLNYFLILMVPKYQYEHFPTLNGKASN